ncbi:MAG: class I SAM-dependent DNA methyltransferase, partial [Planctomycetia bacterium]|nr:class I SAM-dependent DNA methyltransferase [Planctomycetia bacterium]
EARKFLDGLTATKVLDPACGTGNFLYVSMVKLKEIEAEARDWLAQLGETQTDLEHMERTVDPKQFLGIEINPRAVAIAEVVLWIGWLQWHLRDRKSPESFSEPILQAYGNIECRDALLEYDKKELVRDEHGKPVTRWDGVTTKKHPVTGEDVPDDTARVAVDRYVNPRKAEWPQADFVVGNPPFIGNKRMRTVLGDEYTATLRATYEEVPDTADYVMYWWDKAARIARAGGLQRFGLITTNSITQTLNRAIVAEHIQEKNEPLSVTFAIPDHPWVDSADGAAVRVAMTSGASGQLGGSLTKVFAEMLSDEETDGSVVCQFETQQGHITPELTVGTSVTTLVPLKGNSSLSFQGMALCGDGFVLSESEAASLRKARPESAVIRRYLNGRDITQVSRGVSVIDFFGLTEPEARGTHPEAFQVVLDRVKPVRDQQKRAHRRERYWLFGETVAGFRRAVEGLAR